MRWVGKALIVVLWLASCSCVAKPITLQEYAAGRVEYYARVYQVPVELVLAVIEVESNWQPDAVSPKGAAGLMQLMPATALRFGARNRFEIEDNIRAGIAYLAWLMHLFGGDLRLVTAAYLVGESPIQSRGLAYSAPAVYSYVSRIAAIYRVKRRERLGKLSCSDTSKRRRGGK
jgi:soluble lytic murein transglycosylase-like protein